MVYKYYSPQPYNFDALQKRYFFFCKVSKLNDPFDTNLKILGLKPQYVEYASQVVKDYGTCSFSRRADNRSLWALYAQSYTGFAVEYDEMRFEDLIRQYNFRFSFHNVFYVDKPFDGRSPDASFPSWDYEEGSKMIQLSDCIKDQRKRDALFTYMAFMKESKIWRAEDEYRVFVGQDIMRFGKNKEGITFEENGYKVGMPEGIIKSVIIGHNMTEENKKRIFELANECKVPVYITQANVPFHIDIIPYGEVEDKNNV